MPHPDEPTTAALVEPLRLRLILDRLQSQFYDTSPALEQIARSLWPDLDSLREDPPPFSH